MIERALYNIVEDLCLFILKEVIPCDGKYHDATSVLARPEYSMLTELVGFNLVETVIRQRVKTLMYIMCDV
jgi:hypothetical protein